MNISIAIVDTNWNYMERLVEVLQEYEDLTVSVYTNAERFENAMETKRFDVVLFNPDVSETKINLSRIKLGVCLCCDETRNVSLYPNENRILKYQRISKIYKEIVKAYADKVGNWIDFDNSQNTKLIAVYSPIGGSGKTTAALAMASKLTGYGKKVLFLSLEVMDSSSCVNLHTAEDDGITVLLQALDENSNFELKLKGTTKKGFNDIYYVEGFERIVDYNTVTKAEMYEVVEKIRKCGSYDIVMVDLGSNYDVITQAVFEQADSIVIMEKPGDIPMKKIEMFAQQALTREYVNKMCKISNFVEGPSKLSSALDVRKLGTIYNFGNISLKDVVQAINKKDSIDIGSFMR